MKAIQSLALLLSLTGAVRASVLVVDGQNGPYFEIGAAVSAAADGDIVLVKSGSYVGFTVNGKGVSIFADAGAGVIVLGQVQVSNVVVGKTVVLSGLEILPPPEGIDHSTGALFATNVQGSLRIQSCNIVGPNGFGFVPGTCTFAGDPLGADAVHVTGCSDVAVSFSALRGGDSNDGTVDLCGNVNFGVEGGDGLEAEQSRVFLHESHLDGGYGAWAWCYGGTGGAALHVNDQSHAFLSGVHAQGGHGGFGGEPYICSKGGVGGAAIQTADATADAQVLGGLLIGGSGGFGEPYSGSYSSCGSPNNCGDGPDGKGISGSGSVVTLTGASKAFGMPKVLREGQNAPLTFTGKSGESAFLIFSPTAAAIPALRGILLVGSPLFGPYLLGTVPASGTLNVSILVPPLPIGVDGIVLHLQGALVPPAGLATLTNVSVVAVLDAAF